MAKQYARETKSYLCTLQQIGIRKFNNPELLDVTRDPNHHIAFGFGTHFCLGASLARLEIKLFFEQLIERVKSFALAGDPVEMPNAFVYGLASCPMDLTPETS